jgi:hypothetical protein
MIPVVIAALVCMFIAGCTETSVTQQPDEDERATSALDPEEQARLIDEAAKRAATEAYEKGKMEKQAETPRRGPHPLVRDLAVARELVAKALETDDPDVQEAYVHRLQQILTAMQAETPAAVICTHIERAMYHVALQQPTKRQLSDASAEIMNALETSFAVRPDELVPAVLTKLEAAKDQLNKGDAKTARRQLEEGRKLAAQHNVTKLVRQAAAAIDGAETALYRDARAVILAELNEASDRLDDIADIAVVESDEEPVEEDETTDVADDEDEQPAAEQQPEMTEGAEATEAAADETEAPVADDETPAAADAAEEAPPVEAPE